MSEGKLKERLTEIYEHEEGTSTIVEVLDEAKTDYPQVPNIANVTPETVMGELIQYFAKSQEWKQKWFGDLKEEIKV